MSISGGFQYQRPFEKTGFVPLPERPGKKQPRMANDETRAAIPTIYDPTCQDCYDDCYEDKLSEIVLYKMANRCSLRVETIQNIKVRQQEEYVISKKSDNFTLSICQNGTHHLRDNNRKVLMVREAFRLVAKVHGQFHLDGEVMGSIIKVQYPWVSSYHIWEFVMEFPLMCPYCRLFPARQPSLMPTPRSRIWHYLQPTRVDYVDEDENEILTYSRPSAYFPFSISPNILPIQGMLQQLKQMRKFYTSTIFSAYSCEEDSCEHDEYEPEYLICLFVFKQNKYPLLKTNQQIGRLINAVRTKIKELEVRVCNQGTDHLWHRGRNQRILMKEEVSTVLHIMHNSNVTEAEAKREDGTGYFHRDEKLMRFMLEREPGLYPFNIIPAMRPFLNKCAFCSKKKYYAEQKKEELVFEENQMIKFRLKLHEARKRYKATKEIPENLNYDHMLSRNDGLKQETILMPTVVKGQIVDPNDCHPNDPDQKPQVKAMLEKYVNSPQLFQFFSNDLIWLMEFNDKKYPDMIGNENLWIRKYAYDGMYRMILLTTQSMRTSYFTYGECLCVDFVPMMMKRRAPSGRHFEVGFLTGLDAENQPVLFGVCFMSEDLMIYHRKMFQFFFEMMDEVIPGTIVTNGGKNVGTAVLWMKKEDPIRYRFNHYIGWFYVIEDLKKDLSGEYDRNEMLAEFCKFLVEANPITHEKRLIEITSQIVERTILEKFLQSKMKYCLSCLPAAFMGYVMETRRVERLYEILAQNFIYQSKMAHFMLSIFKLDRKLNWQKTKTSVSRNMEIISEMLAAELPDVAEEAMEQLVWAAENLSENILAKLMKNFIESQKIKLLQDKESKQEGDSPDAFFLDSNNLKYSARYFPEDECWRCSCQWVYWTGVPCCHIIKMVLRQGGELRYYVNQRWLIKPQDEEQNGDNELGNQYLDQKEERVQQEEGQIGLQQERKDDELEMGEVSQNLSALSL